MQELILDLNDVMERVQDDRELLMELLDIFVADFKDKRQQIVNYIQNQDFEQLRDISHSMKGAAGNISAKQIFQTCLKLEKKAEAEELDGVDDLTAQLDQEFLSLEGYIGELKAQEN